MAHPLGQRCDDEFVAVGEAFKLSKRRRKHWRSQVEDNVSSGIIVMP
jgi:hypothetical protein